MPPSKDPGSKQSPPAEPGLPGRPEPGDEPGSPGQPASGEEEAGDEGWETSTELPEPAGGGDAEEEEGGAPAERPGSATILEGGPRGDEDLDKQLEVFDGEILEERAGVLTASNERAGGGAGELPESDTSPGDPDGTEAGASADKPPREGPGAGPKPRPVPVAANVPTDLPDAKDDDVVARQLREAAMAEPDPELREALWEEYRRYKAGS